MHVCMYAQCSYGISVSQIKGKAVPQHICGDAGRREVVAPTRHQVGVSGQRRSPAAPNPRGKDPRYPLYRRLGGPQSRFGQGG
jgi:hypothetical protein